MTSRHLLSRERQSQIRDLLIREGDVRCADLAEGFHVSVETIRRDLALLEKRGQATRNHGGAVAVLDQLMPHIDVRIDVNRTAKQRIGQLAKGMIAPQMSVFLGGGSTTLAAAWELRHSARVTFASTMVDVVMALTMGGQEDVTLFGGHFDRNSRAFFGFETMEMIARRHFDIAFLGASAMDAQRGLLGPSERHLELAQNIRRRSRRLVVLATDTALQRSDKFSIMPLRDIDALVTNAPPDPHVYAALDAANVDVHF